MIATGDPGRKGNLVKRVLVTGVSSGLGLAVADLLLAKGAIVYGLSRRAPPRLCEHPNFHFVSIDLGDLACIQAATKSLVRDVAWMDLVILNAAVLGSIEDMQNAAVRDLKRTMNVNLWANKVLVDSLLSLDLKLSQVVAISSGISVEPQRGWSGYALSKGALNTLMALYAAELPDTHFSAISPGLIDTPMQDQLTGLASDTRFFTIEMLKMLKGTPEMPAPRSVAERLLSAVEAVRRLPNGTYTDLETLLAGTSALPSITLAEYAQRRRSAR